MALSKQIFVCFSPSPHILLPRHNLLLLSRLFALPPLPQHLLSLSRGVLGSPSVYTHCLIPFITYPEQ